MKPAFVIVDMQPQAYALASNQSLIKNINAAIDLFIQKRLPILLVSYVGSGRTHRSVYSKLKGYRNLTLVKKLDCDGGKEIYKHTKNKKITHFVFGGIFRCQCVLESVKTLSKMTKSEVLMTKGVTGCSLNDECFDNCFCSNEFMTSDRKLYNLLSKV